MTGYGLVRIESSTCRLVEGGVIRTVPRAPLEARLETLHTGLDAVLREFQPDCMVVEELYSTYAHPRTAILMGHARGVLYLAAAGSGVPVVSYEATLVKKALTGNGRAAKAQVARMVARLLQLAEPPEPADVTDALALALCHARPVRREAGWAEHGGRR